MVQLLGSSIWMNLVNSYFTATKEEFYKSHKAKFETEVSRSTHLHTHQVISNFASIVCEKEGLKQVDLI